MNVQQLGTLEGRRRIAVNPRMSIKYHVAACDAERLSNVLSWCDQFSICDLFYEIKVERVP